MADELRITVLPDGTIKTETDAVSAANHASAEGFLKLVAELTGGSVSRTRRAHGHHHHHQHQHAGGGHTHEH